MRKIGAIKDINLIKAAGADVRKRAAVQELIMAKKAMFQIIANNAEKVAGGQFAEGMKNELVKTACAYFPSNFMLEESDKVFKTAELLMVKLVDAGMQKARKTGAVIFKRASVEDSINQVVKADGAEMRDLLSEYTEEVKASGAKMDGVAASNTAVAADGTSGTQTTVVKEQEGVDKTSEAYLQLMKKISSVVDIIKKKAEASQSEAAVNDGTARGETIKDSDNKLTQGSEPSGEVELNAGNDMDALAAETELEQLLKESGNSEIPSNPISNVTSVKSSVATTETKAASFNIFANRLRSIVQK